tara:strand:+ start:207 stop:677 length:471 start_codon:yes stop_codon:yes gene_type:complete
MEITNKNHKTKRITCWKKSGVIHDDFDSLYDIYINTMECNHCKKDFKNTTDRCLDHDHETGAFRAIVCRNCNNQDAYIKYPDGITDQDRKRKTKEWFINNSDRIKEYKKQWFINNSDRIKEKSNEKYTCECGLILTKGNKLRHEKSKKHINFLNIL